MQAFRMIRVMTILLLAAGLIGCANTSAPLIRTADNFEIKVLFDTNHCPVSAIPETQDAYGADLVGWQSYAETDLNSATDESYVIYYDPFRGQPKTSNRNGKVPATPIDTSIPAVITFKYTIFGKDCTTQPPLDPHIKIL